MHVQLWSYNYDPEPIGIGPIGGTAARALADNGHEVEVISAHPHYPGPQWGNRLLPYREERDGLSVIRLPIWPGRSTAVRRIRQELSFALAEVGVLPALRRPDVILAISPSFPGLAAVMLNGRVRRVPWVLWLQDILPDGAIATEILREGAMTRLARRFERAAYRSAAHIVVISDSFEENLRRKGVDGKKMTRVYNPATRSILVEPRHMNAVGDDMTGPTVLAMGNIGHTQNLVELTRAFEQSAELEALGARFVITGDGVAREDVRAAITTDRVRLAGILENEELEQHLARAAVGVVSQRYEGTNFNVPSKLMTFMGRGVPVVASVPPDFEAARIVRASGGRWVADSGDPHEFAATVARALGNAPERDALGQASLRFAREKFAPERLGSELERILASVARGP